MAYDPYANSFPAAPFDLALPDIDEEGNLPRSAWAESANRSPAVRWSSPPEGTRSLLLTAFDADAPIPGGFWHWLVADIPADVDGLAGGAGDSDQTLPPPARHLQASMGHARFAGVRPPAGTGTHRLFVCATALDIARLPVPVDAGPARLHVASIPHTLGRALATAVSVAPSV